VLREAAEYPNSFVALGRLDERIETDRYTLCMGAVRTWNTVQRQRFDTIVLDEVLAEVRGLLRARGRPSTQWEIGTLAQPVGLVELLLERGLVHDSEPTALALALDSSPPPPAPGFVARRVRTLAEYTAASEVQWEAFESPPDQIAEQRAGLAERWNNSALVTHAVWMDGEIVSAGACGTTPHGLVLFGGATKPSARGRGAYRALIHARWQEAAEWGAPALLTQAGSMSAPILQRLGFAIVGRIQILLDKFD
jgi:hypothetical protein